MANLIRWEDPFAGLTSLHSQIDDMFNNFFTAGLPAIRRGVPAMDIYTEGDKRLVAEVQAPGFDKNDISVSVHDGVLEIKGQHEGKEEQGKQTDRNYMVRESHANFYRSIALPRHADAEHIKADFDNGVLKLTVPFKELP